MNDNLTTLDAPAILSFMKAQVAAWNAHDKAAFMACYREVAPNGLEIEYVGRAEQAEGWFVIEEMYDKHNAQIRLEVDLTVQNGNEVAVHHRNCIVGSELVIHSIETYRFDAGRLCIRYFLKPPEVSPADLQQFRGLAQAQQAQ